MNVEYMTDTRCGQIDVEGPGGSGRVINVSPTGVGFSAFVGDECIGHFNKAGWGVRAPRVMAFNGQTAADKVSRLSGTEHQLTEPPHGELARRPCTGCRRVHAPPRSALRARWPRKRISATGRGGTRRSRLHKSRQVSRTRERSEACVIPASARHRNSASYITRAR